MMDYDEMALDGEDQGPRVTIREVRGGDLILAETSRG